VTTWPGPLESTTTLGICINSHLSFQHNVNTEAAKAKKPLGALQRLGNSNSGMSPASLRALYTGAIRPIFLWGAEV